MSSLREYLEAKDVLGQQAEASQASEAQTSGSSQQRGLDLVLKGEFPNSVASLFEGSGLELSEFTESLEALRGAGLVKVNKTDGEATVELTDKGHALRADD